MGEGPAPGAGGVAAASDGTPVRRRKAADHPRGHAPDHRAAPAGLVVGARPARARGLRAGRAGLLVVLVVAQLLKQKARPPMSQHWICRVAVPALPARSVTVSSAVYDF